MPLVHALLSSGKGERRPEISGRLSQSKAFGLPSDRSGGKGSNSGAPCWLTLLRFPGYSEISEVAP